MTMRILTIVAALAVAALPASAALPPETYAGPLGSRLAAQWNIMTSSFGDGSYVAPWAALKPGQYRNPTSGKVEGAPTGPFSR